jgi:hypothetical protein
VSARSYLSPQSSVLPSDAQSVGDAVDVVEPGGDEGDLKYGPVVEARFAQARVVCGADARGVARELRDVVEHDAVLLGDGRGGVVRLQRPDQLFI